MRAPPKGGDGGGGDGGGDGGGGGVGGGDGGDGGAGGDGNAGGAGGGRAVVIFSLLSSPSIITLAMRPVTIDVDARSTTQPTHTATVPLDGIGGALYQQLQRAA